MMDQLDNVAKSWLSQILTTDFTATKHVHSYQDEVFKIETPRQNYYLKASASLKSERDNLTKLGSVLTTPKVIDFYQAPARDYLLISEVPGKNLVELIGEQANEHIVRLFAQAVRELHTLDPTLIFPEANTADVLIHGDMALPNIIISKDETIGYIDFGQLSFGHPELDLVDAIWSLQRNIGPTYGELFLQEYGSVECTEKIEKALAFRYQPPVSS